MHAKILPDIFDPDFDIFKQLLAVLFLQILAHSISEQGIPWADSE